MNRKQYILDTTITLMQTLQNLGVAFSEADDEIILDTLELHVDKVAQTLNDKKSDLGSKEQICNHVNKTQHFSDVFGVYYSCLDCGKDLEQNKQPQSQKEYLEELRVNDPITYSELTSDPTGVGNDDTDAVFTTTFYMAIIAFSMGVGVGGLFLWLCS
jgi:hypothetical protein